MKKFLLIILVAAIAAPAVGFNYDDNPRVLPRSAASGGYCIAHDLECPIEYVFDHGSNKYYWIRKKCRENGILPPYLEQITWREGFGCGYLEVYFDGGDYTVIECRCVVYGWVLETNPISDNSFLGDFGRQVFLSLLMAFKI